MSEISRRTFLMGTAGVTAAAAATGLFGTGAFAADVVMVGCGLVGLCAAQCRHRPPC